MTFASSFPRAWFCATTSLFLVISAVSNALAQTAGAEQAAAEVLFEEGASLMRSGQLAEACDKFEGSHDLDPVLGTTLRLADCYDRLGRTASSWALFKKAASMARASAEEQRQEIALARVEDLQARLSMLEVRVTERSRVEGLEVKLDDVVIPAASWGTGIPVDPGSLRLRATAPGRESWQRELNIRPGPNRTLVDIPSLDELPEPEVEEEAGTTLPATKATGLEPTLPDPRYDPSHTGETQRVLGYIALGLGGAGIATAGVLAYLTLDSNDQSLDHCLREDANACTPEGKDLRDQALTLGNAATISALAGGGLAATGLFLVLTAQGSKSKKEASAPRLSPTFSAKEAGIQFEGRF